MPGLREKLTEIAYDPSIGARSKLLAAICDLIFDHRSPTQEEVASLCAVAKLLLTVADDTSRCHFAVTIAHSRHVPHDMILLLLQDNTSVVGPILRKSPVLTETDLLAIAETTDDDRLVFIAERDELTAALVEVLATRGNEKVQLAISENTGAELSPKTLQILIGTANTSEALCRSLVRRPEISKADAERLVQFITRMLKARMKISAEQIAIPAAAVEEPKTKKPEVRLDVNEIIAAVKSGQMTADIAVKRLADDDRFNDLTVLISKLTTIDDVSIMRLMVRADANGIGMIMKALEISEATFGSVIALRKRRLKSSDAQMRYERDDYAKLSTAESKATLAQLNGSAGRN